MSFRPDSPLNRLVILWPGVPIAACALGFVLAVIEVSQTHSGSFAALAIAMGCGLAFSVGLLFHSFFIEWTEVTVTREGIALRPVGHVWLNRPPRLVPWDRVHEEAEVLEHVLSEELEELIAAKLGDPTVDPHGDPIPTRELTIEEGTTDSLQTLTPVGR